MKITVDYEKLSAAIATLRTVISDKLAADTLKNVIFSVKADNTIKLAAYNTQIACFSNLDVMAIEWGDGVAPADTYFQLKDTIMKVLDNFKSLKRTKVDKVEIDVNDANAIVTVYESANDAIAADTGIPDEIKASYSHTSKYRVAAPKLASGIQKEIENRDLTVSGVDMNAVDTKFYLNALRSTLPSDAKDTMGTRIMAVGDDIYTAPQLYFAIMSNKLPTEFRDFILSSSSAMFISSYMDNNQTFKFSKIASDNIVQLKFASDTSIAFVNAATTKGALDCTAYKQRSKTGIAIDKQYFSDILNRVGGNDNCSITINIPEKGNATGFITSKTLRQGFTALRTRLDTTEFAESPLLKTDENGGTYLEVAFSIRPDLLKQLMFTGINDGAPAYLYFEQGLSPTSLRLAVCDETAMWITKINSLSPKHGDFDWLLE